MFIGLAPDFPMFLLFFQGDLEKTELQIEPIDMMNREKRDLLPALQVHFRLLLFRSSRNKISFLSLFHLKQRSIETVFTSQVEIRHLWRPD